MSATHRTVDGGHHPSNSHRPAIITRAMVLLLLCTLGSATSFYLLLSVVPLYATSVGAGGVGAGLTTAALMLSTVVAEFGVPWLVRRYGYRLVLAAGMLLMGVPTLGLTASSSLAGILLVCLVRGLGFAIAMVVGSALVASLSPAARRGEGLGIYGLVVGLPSIVALPLGVWLVDEVGFDAVFLAATVSALVGLGVVAGLPGRTTDGGQQLGMLDGLRTPALLRPSLIFTTSTMAVGVVVTFLPLAVTSWSGDLAALALLLQAAAATLTRWWAGRYSDRHGPTALVLPGLVACAVGLLGLIALTSPLAVLSGMVLFGAGFGVVQNAILALMFERVSPSGYGTVSALWNLAYDAGLGIGAAGFGVLAAQTGYPVGFAMTAAVLVVALGPAWRLRRAAQRRGREPS